MKVYQENMQKIQIILFLLVMKIFWLIFEKT